MEATDEGTGDSIGAGDGNGAGAGTGAATRAARSGTRAGSGTIAGGRYTKRAGTRPVSGERGELGILDLNITQKHYWHIRK